MQNVNRAESTNAYGGDFFNAPVLVALLLYCINNWILKSTYPCWITGKLSDVLFCFFFPLYIAAVLRVFFGIGRQTALCAGALATAAVFTAVNISAYWSGALNIGLNWIAGVTGINLHENRADITDLMALPMIALAVCFALRRSRNSIWTQ